MGERTIKLPDVGEGVAEAEIVDWHVKIGDLVREDDVIADVMTDKATVEIPAPCDGKVIWFAGEIGDVAAVGSPLVKLETEGDDVAEETAVAVEKSKPDTVRAKDKAKAAPAAGPEAEPAPKRDKPQPSGPTTPSPAAAKPGPPTPSPRGMDEKPLASPAVRLRAKYAGADLRQVSGSGPAGRITHEDLEAFIARGRQPSVAPRLQRSTDVEEIRVVGLRRRIAEKMTLASSSIPHITYVEEVDVTALEELRAKLNAAPDSAPPRLTILPFLMRAMVKAIGELPKVNAHFDDEAGMIRRFGAVHIGIAAQTDAGLMVPVVRHAEARDLWDCAAEAARLAETARDGTATLEELSGSTITITSLGPLGGIVSTPVINHPEVAIIGVNKIATRPLWDGRDFVPRKVMNLSSSFDHRVIDGWDAAVFVQRVKALLEIPAIIFMEGPGR